MQKTEILIEEDAFGSVRPVEVAMDTPVAVLVPKLVEMLQLPQTDLFGKELLYTLRLSKSGRIIPDHMTLNTAGVLPGMRLSLDSAITEGVPIPVVPASHPLPIADPLLYSSDTLADDAQLPIISHGQTSSVHLPVAKKRRSRRAFLFSSAATLVGVSGVGVGYAAYRAYTADRTLKPLNRMVQNMPVQHKKPPAPANNAPKVVVKERLTFQRHQQIVRSVTWSPTGMLLASGADDSHVLVWDMAGNVVQDILHPGAVRAVAWSPEGQRLVTGSLTRVAFFHATSGATLAHSRHHHTNLVTSVAWAGQNKQQVVSAGADKRAIVWETQHYHPQITYRRHAAAIDAVSWSADGRMIASAADGGMVRVWNAATGQDVHGFYQDAQVPMRAVSFAPGGVELAIGGDDGVLRLWNGVTCVNGGRQCQDVPQRLTIGQAAIRSVAWSPDTRFLAVGTNDGMFVLLQPTIGMKPVFTKKQIAPLRSIIWSPDGKHVATATGNQVKIWDVM